MVDKEKLKKIVGPQDPFWIDVISDFIEATYEDSEEGIKDIEELSKDKSRFNEFTRQVVQRRNDLKGVKEDFFKRSENEGNGDINELKLEISERQYNGRPGVGNIYHKVITVTFDGNKANVKFYLEFVFDEKLNMANIESFIPVIMTDDNMIELKKCIKEIEASYNSQDYEKSKILSPYDQMQILDVKINSIKYAVNENDQSLFKLKELIKYDLISQAINEAYFYYMDNIV